LILATIREVTTAYRRGGVVDKGVARQELGKALEDAKGAKALWTFMAPETAAAAFFAVDDLMGGTCSSLHLCER